jgi:hypothetical protein
MIRKLKQLCVYVLATSLLFAGFTQSVQAAMISTDQIVASGNAQQERAKLASALDRPEVQTQLEKFGISQSDAQARVAALTDAEVASMSSQIDSLPAGGNGVIGALIFIFVVLLVTDVLGLTKVFPFTRSVR